jgi:hypothetical protein
MGKLTRSKQGKRNEIEGDHSGQRGDLRSCEKRQECVYKEKAKVLRSSECFGPCSGRV